MFEDSPKLQKFKYLENETLFFPQMEKFFHSTLTATIWQKIVF